MPYTRRNNTLSRVDLWPAHEYIEILAAKSAGHHCRRIMIDCTLRNFLLQLTSFTLHCAKARPIFFIFRQCPSTWQHLTIIICWRHWQVYMSLFLTYMSQQSKLWHHLASETEGDWNLIVTKVGVCLNEKWIVKIAVTDKKPAEMVLNWFASPRFIVSLFRITTQFLSTFHPWPCVYMFFLGFTSSRLRNVQEYGCQHHRFSFPLARQFPVIS